MCRLDVPKRERLPHGRTFVASYKRVPRSELPPNIVMRHNYRQKAAPRGRRRWRKRGKRGRGLFSFIKNIAKNPMVRELAKKGVQHLPALYNSATNRIKK